MTSLGLDIGIRTAKMAVVKAGTPEGLYVCPLPEGLPQAGGTLMPSEELASALKLFLKKENISVRRCALALPPEAAFIRRVTMPQMAPKQIRVNLPYEFRDYIQGDKSLYFYDYAVVKVEEATEGSAGRPDPELLIAATSKQTIADWRAMLRKAGLKLSVAVPKYLTYRNLISAYETVHPSEHPQEYCIADLGERRLYVHMYRGSNYETTRVIEYSESFLRKWEQSPSFEEQRELYNGVALEILRAVNFYGFNTPGTDLQDLYFGGMFASSPILQKALQETLHLRIHSVEELLPFGDRESARLCPAAAGAAQEGSKRG